MQQGYNFMTKNYNKENYKDDDKFLEKMSIIQFLKFLNNRDERIETQIEVYGLEEFLHFTGKEEAIDILKNHLEQGIDYLEQNFAIVKIITEERIAIWNNRPVLRYKDEEFPLNSIFGTSLRQKESEYWVANFNIYS